MKTNAIIDARHIHKGGIGEYIKHQIDGLILSQAFDEITILCHNPDQLNISNFPSHIKPLSFPRMYGLAEQIAMHRLKTKKCKTVYFSPHVTHPVFPFCPTVVTIHDLIWLKYPHYATSFLGREYFSLMLKNAVKKCSKVICISQTTAIDVHELFKCPYEKIQVIHNGCDQSSFSGLGTRIVDKGYWLYVGSWKPWKKVPLLLQAFDKFMKAGIPGAPNRLVIAGAADTKLADDIPKLVGDSNYKENIQILGPVSQDELVQLYLNAYALVHPAEYEGFGLTILEAMRCGTPVITTNGGSLPEIAGDSALIVTPDNSSFLFDAMRKLSSDPAFYEVLSKKGSDRAKLFPWSRCVKSTIDLLIQTAEA